MSNATIYFFPIREPITPTPDPEVYFEMGVTLLNFDQSVDIQSNELYTLSGLYSRSFYNETKSYQLTILEDDYKDSLGASLDDDAMKMFLNSVRNAESFYITNLDESDRLMEVQMVGRWSRSRVSSADLSKFRYTLTVREVPT